MKLFKIIVFFVLASVLFLGCTNKPRTKKNFCALNLAYADSNHLQRKEVKCVCKDNKDTIIGIGGDWGRKSSKEAMEDIERELTEYFVKNGGREVKIRVMKYLRTDPDNTTENNLDNLPSCEDFFSK
jgi:hypothetical protein